MAKKSNSESQPGSRANGVDLPEVERVLEFMQKHGLEEFEYEREGFRIRLKKPSSPLAATYAPLPTPRNCSRLGIAARAAVAAAPAQAAPRAARIRGRALRRLAHREITDRRHVLYVRQSGLGAFRGHRRESGIRPGTVHH